MADAALPPLIVVGDDGSASSDVVWRWLTGHAWPGWRVEVLTADESEIAWGAPISPEPWSPPWTRLGNVEGAVSVDHLRCWCDPRAMLAERFDASLMVVGRHLGADAGPRFLLGSTSEWLLQHPPVPLAVIGSPERAVQVTACIDGSEHAMTALEAFVAWPAARGADVAVLVVDDGRVDAASALDRASGVLEGRVATIEPTVIEGKPTQVILSYLEAREPDMVVLGTKGLTGWRRIRLGSTAGAVARNASCNLLLGPAGEE